MCTGIELGMAALGAGSLLFGGSNDAPAPPPPVIPATPPSTAQSANAVVKVGDGVDPTKKTATPQFDGFTEKRVTGRPLGGLGRGGLGL